jgi:hypothetical protein
MSTDIQTRSAQIYQFPIGGRDGLNRGMSNSAFAVESGARLAEGVLGGSGWYHDEAIREAEPARTPSH